MAEFLTVDATNLQANIDDVAVKQLGEIGPQTKAELIRTETRLGDELVARARAKASGDVLQVKTGRFVGSIHSETVSWGEIGVGSALLALISIHERKLLDDRSQGVFTFVLSDDKKAPILEFGATLPPHEIEPDTAHALRFLGREGVAFAERVNFPGGQIRPHTTIHAAFSEMQMEIITELENAIAH